MIREGRLGEEKQKSVLVATATTETCQWAVLWVHLFSHILWSSLFRFRAPVRLSSDFVRVYARLSRS